MLLATLRRWVKTVRFFGLYPLQVSVTVLLISFTMILNHSDISLIEINGID